MRASKGGVRRVWVWASWAAAAAVLAGCAAPKKPAPVVDRSTSAAAAPAEPPKPLPGAENAGKPGYYTVKQGDTVRRIALEHNQNWRDIARWNSLENVNQIEVGQVLRVVPPAPAAPAAAVAEPRPVTPAGRVDSKPLEARPAGGADAQAGLPASAAAATSAPVPAPAPASGTAAASAPAPAAAAAPGAADEEIVWAWPAAGPVLADFNDASNKGITIGGKAGDPVLAAADGRVVYAGSSLRGYGNLVIVKHNNTYLSAYAHNQALLVKEDQVVRRGQRIAEMGSSDADRVQLHFEIRRQGKPVDPSRLLPPR